MTRRRKTRRGATAWLVAVAIALVGAVTLFAGALPAAADTTTSGTCTFDQANYNVAPGANVTVTVDRTTSGAAGTATVHVQNWSGVFGGLTADTDQSFSFQTSDTAAADTWTASSNALPGSVANLSFTSPTDCSGSSGTATITVVAGTPTVTSLSPNHGLAGAIVQINGTNLVGATTVHWGGTDLTSGFTVNGQSSITVNSIPSGTSPVQVSVTTPGGTSGSATFTYDTAPAPHIDSLSPTSASAGQNVNINGSDFQPTGGACGANGLNGTVQVFYGTTQAQCTLISNTVLYSTVPPGTNGTTVSVTVTTVNGTSNGVNFTYGSGSTAPNITSISPTSGPVGTLLNIYGTNLAPAGAVTVGGVDCPLISGSTGTHLMCTTGGGVAPLTPQSVVVNGLNGTDTASQTFIYTTTGPVTVTNVVPDSCPLNGGNTLYVYGTGFVSGSTTVHVGTALAANVAVLGSTELSVTCPAQSSYITYDLTVTVGANTSPTTVNDNVTYQVGGAAPVISDVEPNAGPTSGGTAVTITGSNFVSPATVTFDGIAATSVLVQSSTSITAVTPAHAATGLVNVSVSTGNGTDTDVYAFTYTNGTGPAVTSISPTSGPVGTHITITGTNFLNASSVTIGGVSATFTLISSTSISAVVPSGTPLGVVDVRVTTPYGTSPNTVSDNFTNTSSKTITTTLQGFFTLIGWVGIDNLSVADALRGGPNGATGGTNDITSQISVVWGFDSATQTFQAYFPAQSDVPGANDLTAMQSGQGYFIGLVNPNSIVQWTYLLGA